MVRRAASTRVFAALLRGRRLAAATLLPILAPLAWLAPPAPAQGGGGGMEEFEESDPYTKGDKELMAKLGYVSFGPFPWRGVDRTVEVQQTMGGVPALWVETEHFRIGSTLGTYDIPNDREERARLKEELARLKEKLGRFKPPKGELDPWLRLHLYAQRAEELYASFVEDFGLEPADYSETGPYLGHPRKFLVLLCERKSELGRYLRSAFQVENDFSFRWGLREDGMFFGANMEAIRELWTEPGSEPFDSMLHCRMVSGLAASFVEGYRMNMYAAPAWFTYGMGHLYVRRIDPRWITAAGHKKDENRRKDDWKWEQRILNLVKNKYFAKTEDMFGWLDYSEISARDHMIAWSKLDYLVHAAKGDKQGFLRSVCRFTPGVEGGTQEELTRRQTRALLAHFELTPEELDKAWSAWVKKTYKKR